MDELSLRQLNGSEDEEEALRRALALSMGEDGDTDADRAENLVPDSAAAGVSQSRGLVRSASTATTASEASEASPSEEPSKPEAQGSTGSEKGEPVLATAIADAGAASKPAVSLLGLDRKAMEAERLARRQRHLEQQAKSLTGSLTGSLTESQSDDQQEGQEGGGDLRQTFQPQNKHFQQAWKLQPTPTRAPTLTPTERSNQAKRKAHDDIIVIDDDDTSSNEPEAKSRNVPPPARRRKLDRDNVEGKVAEQQKVSVPSSSLPYAKGVVKKTRVRGQPRMGDDITIDELWQKNQLELAVLSSFQWDEDWMLAHLDMSRTRLYLVAYAADENQKEQMRANVPGDTVRFCFPRMQAVGNMHSKLQLLKFPGYLRIAVPTGNLVPYDWGETGTIENMVFIIDLPRLPKESRDGNSPSTPFLEDLSYFLEGQGVDDNLIRSLRNFDFSETARYAFVHSMAGSYTDDAWKRTGYCGLGRAVKALGWETTKPVQLDYICSSIGSVKDDLLNALYYACQGDSGLKEYGERASRSRKKTSAPASQNSPKNRLRLYFPSQETVANSLGGETVPEQSVSKRNVRSDSEAAATKSDENSRPRGWAYIGSANMSESAWGRLVKDRATGKTKMTCRNWECGVLVAASPHESVPATAGHTEDGAMLNVFRRTVPVPILVPGVKYQAESRTARRQPWFFMEQ